MKVSATAALLAAALPIANGLNLVKRSTPSVLEAKTHRRKDVLNPVEHDRVKHGYRHSIDKRQDVVSASLTNEVTLYYIDISLGSPAQSFSVHIDTGSSDLWVNTASSRLCTKYERICSETGTYSSSDSTTYTFINNYFNISYADGSGAIGPYVSDTLTLGSTTLDNFQFGIGESSSSTQGILGIGYVTNEAVVQTSTRLIYPNLPAALVSAGAIQTNAYSLWLDDLSASEGTLLFGGVNSAKYTGDLVTFPILATYGVYTAFYIGMTGLGLNGDATSIISDQNIAVLLDSGTSLTYLPNQLASALFQEYDTTFSSSQGAAPVPCSLADQSGSVDFAFPGLTISVPLSELVINLSNNQNAQTCAFGIAPSGDDGTAVLGDTFLRSAYVVYDLDNNQVSMAQTNTDPGADNILEIQSGSNGIPSATTATGAVTSAGGLSSGVVGNLSPTSFSVSGTVTITPTQNGAWAAMTAAPMWQYGGGLAAGAAALAML